MDFSFSGGAMILNECWRNTLNNILVCPACGGGITFDTLPAPDCCRCSACGVKYPVVKGIPVLQGATQPPTFYRNASYEKLLASLGPLHKDYYGKTFTSGFEDFIRKQIFNLVTRVTPPVVDFGCGTGSAFHVFEKYEGLVGIDINLDLLKISRARFPNIPLICCDFATPPFRSGSINTIFSLATLEHVFHLERSLESMERCLADNGVVYIMVPNEGNLPWSLLRTLYTAPRYSRMFNLDYHEAMSRSHCNNIWTIENALYKFFEFDRIGRFPFGLGGKSLNLISFYRLKKRAGQS